MNFGFFLFSVSLGAGFMDGVLVMAGRCCVLALLSSLSVASFVSFLLHNIHHDRSSTRFFVMHSAAGLKVLGGDALYGLQKEKTVQTWAARAPHGFDGNVKSAHFTFGF